MKRIISVLVCVIFMLVSTGNLGVAQQQPVTLKVGTFDNWYTPKSYALNLPVWQEVEKRLNIKIQWEVAPATQWRQIITTRFAAGKDLPEIVGGFFDVMQYAQAGLIIPLNDLIDKYAPNIRAYFKEHPEIKKLLTAPDGKIYHLSSVIGKLGGAHGFIIRQDWLDVLGLKQPQTLDDWYKVLKAFKENDPNRNGKRDEIPFCVEYGGRHLAGVFSWAYGLHGFYSNYFWPDKSGKVVYEVMDPKFKELLTMLNKWYKEGLIDPEFATMSYDKFITRLTSNNVGAFNRFVHWIDMLQATMRRKYPKVDWRGTTPPQGPYGDRLMERYGPISGVFVITRDCKNPEAAIKLFDYIWASKEGHILMTFGIEGLSYTMKGGVPRVTNFVLKNPDGLGPWEAIRSIGAWPNLPYRQSDLFYQQVYSPKVVEAFKRCEKYLVDPFPGINMLPTKEESEILKAKWTDIDTYVSEMRDKFITGQESLDNFDKFIAQLKAMGIEDVIKVYQARYDRFLKAK